MLISGSAEGGLDSKIWQKKRLVIQSISPKNKNLASGKYLFSYLSHKLVGVRSFLLESVNGYLPVANEALVAGMTFGYDENFNKELAQLLKTTGMLHVVSASGYNVGLVTGIVFLFGKKNITRRWLALLTGMVVIFYTVLAGSSLALIRAAVMAVIALFSSLFLLRQYSPLWALFLTVCLLLLWKPFTLFSASFQLSVSATLGIIIFIPILTKRRVPRAELETSVFEINDDAQDHRWSFKKFLSPFREAFVTTLAAQVFTTPILLAWFGEFSLISLLSNTLLLWTTPIITVLGVVVMIIGAFLSLTPGLASFFMPIMVLPIWFLTELFLEVNSILASLY